MMNESTTESMISDADLDWLDNILLSRIDESENSEDKDEGILELTELDGFFTAIVSAPRFISPSLWLPSIWGDFEPEWENESDFERAFSIMINIMNSISYSLIEEPDEYEPLFPEGNIEGQRHLIVDEWCLGYIRGMGLCPDDWNIENEPMLSLLMPIITFGSQALYEVLDSLEKTELEALKQQITPSVKKVHAYWLEQREDEMSMSNPVFDAEFDELPEYNNDYLKTLSEAELIEHMIDDEDRVPRNVIDECANRGEKMVEALASIADPNERKPFETLGRWWMRLHAIMILGLIPGEKAGMMFMPFINYLRISEDGEIQDWLAGYWPALTRNKPATVIHKLRELCEDTQIDWYTRINLVEAVIADAKQQGGQTLETSLDWLAGFVSDENEDWEFRFPAAACLLHFPRERYRELLGHMASLQDEFDRVFDRRDIESAYALNIDQPEWENEREPWDFYQTSAIIARNQSWIESEAWDAEDEIDYEDDLFSEPDSDFNWDMQQPFERKIPKVGRNDPCPCGSGKKFKKCCLH